MNKNQMLVSVFLACGRVASNVTTLASGDEFDTLAISNSSILQIVRKYYKADANGRFIKEKLKKNTCIKDQKCDHLNHWYKIHTPLFQAEDIDIDGRKKVYYLSEEAMFKLSDSLLPEYVTDVIVEMNRKILNSVNNSRNSRITPDELSIFKEKTELIKTKYENSELTCHYILEEYIKELFEGNEILTTKVIDSIYKKAIKGTQIHRS